MTAATSKNPIQRPPIVCIMGHIDHGKSTLLDYIRKTNIVDKEAGGITQRISAYEVVHKTPEGKDEKITFLDTPGHEAFGAMRISGTAVADIAVLIVSAEDGVKKQTIEAWKTIQEAGIPVIVAINKIDKPEANVEKTKNSLVENEIYIEGYGGTIPCVLISAKKGMGVSELLDMILLVAELGEFTGSPKKLAEGVVIEAHLDKQKGITATVVIKDGHIGPGMFIVSGESIAPTRAIEDFLGKKIKEAQFSSPVRIVGFDALPISGKPFLTFDNKKEAEEFVALEKQARKQKVTAEEIDSDTPVIRIMIKADVGGAIPAIEHEIAKIATEKVRIRIIGSSIGSITENDVKLAGGRNPAIILGFDVRVDGTAKDLAERTGVAIATFDIIYKISEWLAEEVAKRTPKEFLDEITAEVKVLKYFSSLKDKHVIGARVEDGLVSVGQEAKIIRAGEEIGRGKIRELQQQKNKVSDVREGVEFGCQFQSDVVPAPGDKLAIFHTIEK